MIRHTEELTAELAAVWKETFDAAATILQAAERIDALSATVESDVGREISLAVNQIFEACTFQDIAGQRIVKVAGVLCQDDRYAVPALSPANVHHESDIVMVDVSDDSLLNGPQLHGKGLTQNEIDNILGFNDGFSDLSQAMETGQARPSQGVCRGRSPSMDVNHILYNKLGKI